MTFRSRIPPTTIKISNRPDVFTFTPGKDRKRQHSLDGVSQYEDFRGKFCKLYNGLEALQMAIKVVVENEKVDEFELGIQYWPDEISSNDSIRGEEQLAGELEGLSLVKDLPTQSFESILIDDFVSLREESDNRINHLHAHSTISTTSRRQKISKRFSRIVDKVSGKRRIEPKKSPAEVFRDILAEACYQREVCLERYPEDEQVN